MRRCFTTVADMHRPAGTRVIIFDDHSQTFDVTALAGGLGLDAECRRQPFRIGADAMIYLIWLTFLSGNEQHLLMLDSDMISNRSALVDGLALVQAFDGLLSLYNSVQHPPIGQSGELVFKDRLGNTGTLWTRDLVAMVKQDCPMGGNLDDRYCRFLKDRGVQLACTARSRVQHLGIEGTNNRYFGEIEHGRGFVPDGAPQWQALAETYDDLMSRQAHFTSPRAP